MSLSYQPIMLLHAFSRKVGPRPLLLFPRGGGGGFEIKGGGGGGHFFCPLMNASANFAFRKTFISPVGPRHCQKSIYHNIFPNFSIKYTWNSIYIIIAFIFGRTNYY